MIQGPEGPCSLRLKAEGPGGCRAFSFILKLRISSGAYLNTHNSETLICFESSELAGFPRFWGLDNNLGRAAFGRAEGSGRSMAVYFSPIRLADGWGTELGGWKYGGP